MVVTKEEFASEYSSLRKEIQNYLGTKEDELRRWKYIAPYIADNTVVKDCILECLDEETSEDFFHCLKKKIPKEEIEYKVP